MKKILVAVILIVAVIIPLYILVINPEPTNPDYVVIEGDAIIAQNLCEERNIQDKVIVIHSKYCSACEIVIPLLQEIEQETGKEFIYLDLSKQEDIDALKYEYKIIPKYTPTVLIGCRAFVSIRTKEQYATAIKNMW